MDRKPANRASLTVDRLAKLKPGETLWDTHVRGLCARRQRSEAVTFYVKYRTQRRRMRWYRIGPWKSPWGPESARVEARKVLTERDAGHDPQAGREAHRRALSVTDLLTTYITDTGKAKKLKPRTIAEYARIRDDIIGPKLGRIAAVDLTAADVETLHKRDLGDRPYLANRVLALLHAAYRASASTLRLPVNPAQGRQRHDEVKRERVLSLDELRRAGVVMRRPDVIEREGIYAIGAVAFLILTGRRKEEALRLQWLHLSEGLSLMAVPDHKASRKKGTAFYSLSAPTVRLLKSLPRIDGNPFVFASTAKEGAHFVAIDATWRRICEAANIHGTRIHDLRRTHSTHAANLGVELLSTSKMLGHSSVRVTESVYTQIEARNLRPVANKVAGSLAAIMGGKRLRRGRKP